MRKSHSIALHIAMPAHSLLLSFLAVVAPLYSGEGIEIPEPSNMALMAMGLVGLIVGRQTAKNKRRRDDTTPED